MKSRQYTSHFYPLNTIVFPRKLPRRLPAFLAVWRGQPETEAALVDLKGYAAPVVVVCLLTMLRSGKGVGRQPVSDFLLDYY